MNTEKTPFSFKGECLMCITLILKRKEMLHWPVINEGIVSQALISEQADLSTIEWIIFISCIVLVYSFYNNIYFFIEKKDSSTERKRERRKFQIIFSKFKSHN